MAAAGIEGSSPSPEGSPGKRLPRELEAKLAELFVASRDYGATGTPESLAACHKIRAEIRDRFRVDPVTGVVVRESSRDLTVAEEEPVLRQRIPDWGHPDLTWEEVKSYTGELLKYRRLKFALAFRDLAEVERKAIEGEIPPILRARVRKLINAIRRYHAGGADRAAIQAEIEALALEFRDDFGIAVWSGCLTRKLDPDEEYIVEPPLDLRYERRVIDWKNPTHLSEMHGDLLQNCAGAVLDLCGLPAKYAETAQEDSVDSFCAERLRRLTEAGSPVSAESSAEREERASVESADRHSPPLPPRDEIRIAISTAIERMGELTPSFESTRYSRNKEREFHRLLQKPDHTDEDLHDFGESIVEEFLQKAQEILPREKLQPTLDLMRSRVAQASEAPDLLGVTAVLDSLSNMDF